MPPPNLLLNLSAAIGIEEKNSMPVPISHSFFPNSFSFGWLRVRN